MNYVVFDKWAVERVKWSSLVAIGDTLKQRGNKVEYFIPRYFSPERAEDTGEWVGDIPNTSLFNTSGIFVWSFNPDTERIVDFYRKHAPNVDVFTVDYGFLKRDEGYWFVMKNNKFPSGCPEDRFKNFGIKVVPYENSVIEKPKATKTRNKASETTDTLEVTEEILSSDVSEIEDMFDSKGHILVCKQNHHDKWYDSAMKQLFQSAKNHKIRVREYDSEKPLVDDLKGAFACVTYNSTALYQALINRIPVFCDKECAASEFCETNLYKVEKAKKIDDDVLPFLYNVAYSQYTLSELKAGEFLEIL